MSTRKSRKQRSTNNSSQKPSTKLKPQTREELEITRKLFQGPLPQPEDLAKYGEISPDIVKTIVDMAQRQQAHRHSIETRDQKLFPILFLFGEIVGFAIAFTIIICSTFLLYNDKDIAGYTTLVTAIAGLVGVFISRNKRMKELDEDN